MLTAKQERFVQELIKGKSQREAYKAAYNAERMKDSTIDNKAYILFKRGDIRARYDELMDEISRQVVVDAAYVKQLIIDTELAILQANAYDFIHGSDEEKHAKAIKNYKVDAQGRVSYEFYDKQAAINTLREMFGIGETQANSEITVTFKGLDEYAE